MADEDPQVKEMTVQQLAPRVMELLLSQKLRALLECNARDVATLVDLGLSERGCKPSECNSHFPILSAGVEAQGVTQDTTKCHEAEKWFRVPSQSLYSRSQRNVRGQRRNENNRVRRAGSVLAFWCWSWALFLGLGMWSLSSLCK